MRYEQRIGAFTARDLEGQTYTVEEWVEREVALGRESVEGPIALRTAGGAPVRPLTEEPGVLVIPGSGLFEGEEDFRLTTDDPDALARYWPAA